MGAYYLFTDVVLFSESLCCHRIYRMVPLVPQCEGNWLKRLPLKHKVTRQSTRAIDNACIICIVAFKYKYFSKLQDHRNGNFSVDECGWGDILGACSGAIYSTRAMTSVHGFICLKLSRGFIVHFVLLKYPTQCSWSENGVEVGVDLSWSVIPSQRQCICIR